MALCLHDIIQLLTLSLPSKKSESAMPVGSKMLYTGEKAGSHKDTFKK